MAGNTLEAPPCTRKQEEKRKQIDATNKGEKAKKKRPSQANVVEHPSGTVVPVTPLHCATSNSMAMVSPNAGVNGAALFWSTAATSASRAVALSLPAMANANGPSVPSVLAPALGLQAPGSESNIPIFAPPMPMANVHGFPVYLVSARPDGQLVLAPLQYIGHGPIAGVSHPKASAVGLPLAAALLKFRNDTLGRMLSALMPACHPPLQHYQSKTGAPPPWWPTASEHWWVPEVEAHLGKMPVDTPVPFSAGYNLKKTQKVAVLVAIVKHLTPDFSRIFTAVSRSKLTKYEAHLWNNALRDEHAKCMRPMVFLQLQPQQQLHSDDQPLVPRHTTSGGIIASDGSVQVGGASVTAPANDGVQVVAGLEQEQHSNGVNRGGIVAADAPPVENGGEQPVNFPGDDSVHFGAAITALTDDVVYDCQVAADLEPQLEEHGDMYVATAEQEPDDMLWALLIQQEEEVQRVADVGAFGAASVADVPEDHNHIFANTHIPPGTPHSFDDGWF
ncbi:hypothetical protein BS78_06G039600 [Paspalum vaginatum]|nr:hypothetical protein BS78_06G039600 [Paspalum vaginatum]